MGLVYVMFLENISIKVGGTKFKLCFLAFFNYFFFLLSFLTVEIKGEICLKEVIRRITNIQYQSNLSNLSTIPNTPSMSCSMP
jgi:hypothetical protein